MEAANNIMDLEVTPEWILQVFAGTFQKTLPKDLKVVAVNIDWSNNIIRIRTESSDFDYARCEGSEFKRQHLMDYLMSQEDIEEKPFKCMGVEHV